MYYLYHIKGVKWGCTINLKKRLKVQGYTLDDVCEIVKETDIDKAADMEKQLNISCGYDWNDGQDYRVMIKAINNAYKNKERVWNGKLFTKEECSLGGYIVGKYPTEKSIIARKKNMSKLNEYKTCPYCGINSRGLGYNRYHGEKCKQKV
jgi:hypothetical protein